MSTLDNVDLAHMLSALGHPLRLGIFQFAMRQGPDGVAAGAIATALDIGASNLSFHLKELRQADWLACQRRGQHIFYRARYDRVQTFLDIFQTQCCADAPAGCAPVCGANTGTEASTTAREKTP